MAHPLDPMWQQTEKEMADSRNTQAKTDALYIEQGVLHPDEVASSRFQGIEYSYDTNLDPDLRLELESDREEAEKMAAEAEKATLEPADGDEPIDGEE